MEEREWRISNVYQPTDGSGNFALVKWEDLRAWSMGAIYGKPLPLTKEILKNNLGFEVHDMGDFWQCEKEDFVLIQVKLQVGHMPYMFMLKSSIKESVNFYHVHHLQNTYLDLKGELLLWKS